MKTDFLKIDNLKDMMNKTRALYGDKPAYKLRDGENGYRIISHREVRDMVDALGTALIHLGLKGKRIAVIGENRYEWELAYLSVACGTGIVVPLDKSLPENELAALVQRSEIEAIFYTNKYTDAIKKIKYSDKNKLKHLISMDKVEHEEGVYSQEELIETGRKLLEEGNREFLDAEVDSKKMNIMLFTSGTTSAAKAVMLSHSNICTNLMDLNQILDIDSSDTFLSILPIHHVFECTVGFLFALYTGAQTVFCDGIRHIVENLKEYNVSFMANVPAMYERIYMMIRKDIEKQGRIDEFLKLIEENKDKTMEEKKVIFKEIHDMLGGNIKLFISGAAALDPKMEEKYRNIGLNIVQGYGLTETSPVVAVGTNEHYRLGSIGISVPSVEAKIIDANDEGVGELCVKGGSIMMGYYENEEATKEVLKDGWFSTGDLARIDEDGYIFICGRKKSVIVLKNGKNIYPEEMENLVNKIEGVTESFIFGKQLSDDKENIKINVEIVFDRETVKEVYKVETDEEIYKVLSEQIKVINKTMPQYKAIRGMIITEKPLIKTTTNKIKRQANLDAIEKNEN